MKWILALTGLILLMGCLGEGPVATKYVCPDQRVVDVPGDCPRTRECEEAKTVFRYVCPDGSVKDKPGGCGGKTTVVVTTPIAEAASTGNGCASLGCPDDTLYVGSLNSDKYHECTCKWAQKISEKNLACFKSKQDAEDKGYKPCGVCNP